LHRERSRGRRLTIADGSYRGRGVGIEPFGRHSRREKRLEAKAFRQVIEMVTVCQAKRFTTRDVPHLGFRPPRTGKLKEDSAVGLYKDKWHAGDAGRIPSHIISVELKPADIHFH
jgi:hypothetical protein